MLDKRFESLKTSMEEGVQDLLGFWEKYDLEPSGNAFYGVVNEKLEPQVDGKKHIVLGSRLVWTFAAAYRVLGKEKYKDLAKKAYDYFMEYFLDREFGGAYWELNADGSVHDPNKRTYGESFAIYALSEYYRAFGDQKALDEAVSIYNCLEKYVYDTENKGYIEALTREWKYEQEKQVSNINPYKAASKTMNTHLHLLEAYTSLYRVWKDEGLKAKLHEHIDVMKDKIVDSNIWHYKMFFDREWNSLSPNVSYGHDIEGSWLIWEAADVLGDKEVMEYVKPVSTKMANATFNEGWHRKGGLLSEADPNGPHENRSWWEQAEAVVGFLNGWELTGEERYLEGADKILDFIDKEMVDHEHGGWFASPISDVVRRGDRVTGWVCPYHNARMYFEVIERIEKLEKNK